MAVHPDNSNLILTGGQGNSTTSNWSFALTRSTNGGSAWQRTFVNQSVRGYCYSVVFAPSNPDTVYAAGFVTTAGAVARSVDAGATWIQVGAPPDTVFGLEVHPEDAAVAYATTSSGAYQTTDAGVTWTRQLNRRGMRSVKAFPGQPGTLVAGGDAGVCISYDGGENWEDMNDGLPERPVHCLEFALVAPFGELRLFAGTVGSAAYTWSFNVGVEEPRAGGTLPRTRAATVAANTYRHPGNGPATLYDRLGREAAMLQPGENDISGLKAGIYFVRTESGKTDTKLLIAR